MAKIYSQLERASFENLSSDPSPGTAGRVFFNTTEGRAKIDTGFSIEPLGEGGSSGINYIEANPDAEVNVDGWDVYKDAAQSTPEDGTGGTPGITLTRTTVTPLRGTGSFLISKGASNRQGEGISYDFAIDPADEGKSLRIAVDYKANSGFVSGDNSDLTVYVYDIDAAILITPSEVNFLASSGVIDVRFNSTSSTNYRLIFHIATVSAAAWEMRLDNVQVGPQESTTSAAIEDWNKDRVFTFTGLGTVVNPEFITRRVGDSLEIRATLESGTPTAVPPEIILPTGLTIDSAKIDQAGGTPRGRLGTWELNDNPGPQDYAAGSSLGAVFTDNASLDRVFFTHQGATNTYDKVNATTFVAAGDELGFQFIVPIAQWSSNIVLANATTFNVSSSIENGTNVTAAPAALGEYRTYIKDAAATTATDDAPGAGPSAVNGMRIYGNANFASAGTSGQTNRWEIFVGKNKNVLFQFYETTNKSGHVDPTFRDSSSTDNTGVLTDYDPISGVAIVDAIAQGGSVTTRNAATKVATAGGSVSLVADIYFDIVVSEKVIPVEVGGFQGAIYTSDATQSFLNNSWTPINYEDVEIDPLTLATTTPFLFTAQRSGTHTVHATFTLAAFAPGGEFFTGIRVNKNAGTIVQTVLTPRSNTVAFALQEQIAADMELNAGDTLAIEFIQDSGLSRSQLGSNPDRCRVSIYPR